MIPTFSDALAGGLRRIPAGRAVACSDIARALGDVRAARAVAEWARAHPDAVGAHRVVRADGSPLAGDASRRLREEGVPLEDGRVVRSAMARPPRVPGIFRRLRAEQERLAARVSERDELRAVRRVGAVDVAYEGGRAHAAAVLWDVRERRALETAGATLDVDFPYVPTYLAFREFPAARAALARLSAKPDVVLIDGHGRLHPAGFGFACYAGVSLRTPTIGVAKHLLVGRPRADPRRGDEVPIEFDGEVRGFAWTPSGRARPVYVSIGHRVSLEAAMRVVRDVSSSGGPEPLRLADALARKRKGTTKGEKGSGS